MHIVGFTIDSPKGKALIVSGYLPPHNSNYFDKNYFKKLEKYIEKHHEQGAPLYVIGDFNAQMGIYTGDYNFKWCKLEQPAYGITETKEQPKPNTLKSFEFGDTRVFPCRRLSSYALV